MYLDSGLLDGGLLLILGGAHSLLSLGFSHLRLLVPLRHDVLGRRDVEIHMSKFMLNAQESNLQSCSNDGTLELLGTASPLLGHILLKTLLVLPNGEKWYRQVRYERVISLKLLVILYQVLEARCRPRQTSGTMSRISLPLSVDLGK